MIYNMKYALKWIYTILCLQSTLACTENFAKSLFSDQDLLVQSNKLFIFPNIKFTCDGVIVNWTFSGTFVGNPNQLLEFPELQVWEVRDDHYRLSERSSYRNINLPVTGDDQGRIWFTPTTPVNVDEGEVLGLLIRNKDYSDETIKLHFIGSQSFATWYHYYITPSNPVLEKQTVYKSSFTSGQNLIPLITVQFVQSATKSTLSTSAAKSTSSTKSTLSTLATKSTPSALASKSGLSTDLPVINSKSTSGVMSRISTRNDLPTSETLILSATSSAGVNLEEQISDTPSVNYWMIGAIIMTLICVGLLVICIITVLVLLKIKKGELSTSTGTCLPNTDVMQQHRMDEDGSRRVDANMRDGVHPRRHTEMLESMYTNNIYVERNEIDEYTNLELQDYNHVYASPFRKQELDIYCSSMESTADCAPNPAYQVGSYQSDSSFSRMTDNPFDSTIPMQLNPLCISNTDGSLKV